ncbi:MAG: metallophosphoesterase [Desulfobacterales bacterium]|nr:metallophosphoesterase [Desulfobacterales bacterium]
MRLIIFLTTFLTLYGGLHVYAYLKVRGALHPGIKGNIVLIAFMILMNFSPIIVRVSEQQGFEWISRFLAWIGYTWMGLLFLFFFVSLSLDAYRLILYLSSRILSLDFSRIAFSPRIAFYAAFILSFLMAAYSYYDALQIRTEYITLPTSKISADVGRLKIVQISDVHLGLIVREQRLKRILKAVNAEQPDILVSTGDLVDGQINNLTGLANMFEQVKTRYGKYAITGNHEFYAGLDRALEFIKKSGFSILRGRSVSAAGVINIAGVDDPAGKRYQLSEAISENELLSNLPEEKFTLLLKHRPWVDEKSASLFDLQLSGHVHKGQIFPFYFFVKLSNPNDIGLSRLPSGSYLYVSRGSGTWGPPMRFLAPPEVTVIELVHAENP